LIPTAKEIDGNKVVLYVLPRLVGKESMLYNVENENNGVLVKAAFADEQFFYGKGAGGHPTGSAVLSDIAALRYGYRYEYKKHLESSALNYSQDYLLKVYLRYTDDQLIEKLNFSEITERYYAADFKYVIGYINLQQIAAHKADLDQEGNFIAEIA